MRPTIQLGFAAACLITLASVATAQASWPAPAPTAGQQAAPQEVSPWEQRIAAVLLVARDEPTDTSPSSAARLAFLGPPAAAAMLDALLWGRVVPDPQDATHDLLLNDDEHAVLRAALVRVGRQALLPIARQGAEPGASPAARQRALLTLELVGLGADLELATAAAQAEDVQALRLQRALQAATQATCERDADALKRLRPLLERAPDAICTGLVRGVAGSGRAEVLLALADELDRHPRHEPLLLSELARAASAGSAQIDARVLLEVRERLTSRDPLLARTAAIAAAALEDFEALPALIELLDAQVEGVRREAHGALRDITGLPYSAEPGPWSAWLERERSWYERRMGDLARDLAGADGGRALVALREIAEHRYRRHELAERVALALDHPDPVVRGAACSTLAALGSQRVTARLLERLEDVDADVAAAARASLDGLRGPAEDAGPH